MRTNTTTIIAEGFFGEARDLLKVLECTVNFLGRKITRNEYNAIRRSWKTHIQRLDFYRK